MQAPALEHTEDVVVYHPRQPHDPPLWNVLQRHFVDFAVHYEERFVKEYGFLHGVVGDVIGAYLKCGDLKEGFARVRCPACHHEYLLAFNCRGRWFCPSCHAKKVVQFGCHLQENLLQPEPHRQYVLNIPIILRRYFLYNRKLPGKLCLCANKSLVDFFR